jgi:pyruvate dehydrogenase E1 component alpha subunit
MNMAALWKLPVIYVCENNLYGEYTPCGDTIAGENLARARAFGIQAESVDGQDVQLVYATMRRLVERARRGEGPAFLECKTYRFYGHHQSDETHRYRTEAEEAAARARDPLLLFRERVLHERTLGEAELDRIDAWARAEVDEAVAFAEAGPLPEVEELYAHVYVD